jgi:hypothetical protein
VRVGLAANVLEEGKAALSDLAVDVSSGLVDDPAGVVDPGEEVLVEGEVGGEAADKLVVEEGFRDGTVGDKRLEGSAKDRDPVEKAR